MSTILVPDSSINFYCSICNYLTCRKSQYERHLSTAKHKNQQISSKKVQGTTVSFCCKLCNYITSRKSQYERHLSTAKHKNQQNLPILEYIVPVCSDNLLCKCGKKYKDRSGLWRHKNKCKLEKTELKNTNEPTDKELVMLLIKENSELKNMMMKVIENGTNNTNNTTNNTNNITNNKTFNLQIFLNETCKDAMNIMDFVESIQLQLSDLENVGKLGYVEGISNIITKNLKALDVTQRPVHCADKKREVLYVKDENKWEKEDDTKKKIRKAIESVVSKNQRLIPKFKEAHPDCGEYSSLFSDQYDHIILESMGGTGDNDIEKEDKIIRNISSVTTINK